MISYEVLQNDTILRVIRTYVEYITLISSMISLQELNPTSVKCISQVKIWYRIKLNDIISLFYPWSFLYCTPCLIRAYMSFLTLWPVISRSLCPQHCPPLPPPLQRNSLIGFKPSIFLSWICWWMLCNLYFYLASWW